jgi:hypothetical protein
MIITNLILLGCKTVVHERQMLVMLAGSRSLNAPGLPDLSAVIDVQNLIGDANLNACRQNERVAIQ